MFFGRFVPILRTLISIPAGITRMNLPIFIIFTALGTGVWNIFLIFLGSALGDHMEQVLQYVGFYSKALIAILVILALIVIYRWWRRAKRENG
ncbi:DedA family protein [Staphylococcus schleiferi]|uniref:DedA family protein n=1 Tax=Staphylococcus schleiferi TaxID=1295 RepID=UPI00316ACFC6